MLIGVAIGPTCTGGGGKPENMDGLPYALPGSVKELVRSDGGAKTLGCCCCCEPRILDP